MERKVICALDTSSKSEAIDAVHRLKDHVGAFKIGHALTLSHGLEVIHALNAAGAKRIFLDLKFHDIPNSVGLAVKQAASYGVWMMTLHIAGGPAMMTAAVEEASTYPEDQRPLLIGVSVLTSLDQHVVTDHLGIQRSIPEHMKYLSQLAVDCGMDGVVCSPQEVKTLRSVVHHPCVIVCPGIRLEGVDTQDQRRVGSATQALCDGADYLVMGRSLIKSQNPTETLLQYGLGKAGVA
ncbi:MAG: orotidine-5'-phosphate decarboxylase [Armatimonadetes bacterium]|nr:orotidine-5'-phosphate decarboxylase [Armatimonadota bacterium]